MPTTAPRTLTGAALFAYIFRGARRRNLDPLAVLSVVHSEGGLYAVTGDGGTSFGPFQLHRGGALPAGHSSDAQAWANSPEGVDYALNQIQGVASGERGPTAIYSIVNGFEHPLNVPAEVSSSEGIYQQLEQSPHASSNLASDGTAQLIGFWDDVGGIFGKLNPGSPFKNPFDPKLGGLVPDVQHPIRAIEGAGNSILPDWFSLRNAERGGMIVIGLVLTLVGLVLLGLQAGKSGPVGQVSGAAGAVKAVAA